MVSGGSDNPGGLKNRAPRGHLICDDNPRTAPLIPARPAAPPGGEPPHQIAGLGPGDLGKDDVQRDGGEERLRG
jgi:hypothetical protein